MKQPDSLEWQNAIDQEIEKIKWNFVFEITPLQANIKPIGGGWAFMKKPALKTCNARYKAQYVAQGNSKLSVCDLHETFALTENFTSLRLLLTTAVHLNWHTSSFDFCAAYLNAPIDEELWIRPPEGMAVPKGHCCKLRKALYGTFQAGRCDIDDLHLSLAAEFGLKWSPKMDSIVGLDIHKDAHGFHLSQVRLIQSILTDHWDQKEDYDSPLPAKCDLLTLPE
ncbi:hypothetical protein O181_002313 [Austropuccinia psidii MF-1]|uniref:Reverse transcriptase Ty1/copia-type domain-containing protein n=1 Tax=Austropuccinia psidii MF-1 TaxID=1389203 RepID=A0A9Q3BCH6_9BASI|nr:hypothetical protein [Austropuccinia psidii MF-1]